AREEGRPGPFSVKHREAVVEEKPKDRIVHVTTFEDPLHEMDHLQDLYESLTEARRETGEEAVPLHKLADVVKNQITKLRQSGNHDIAFRAAVKEAKVTLTARSLKGAKKAT